ncbi:Crp/Fnr family transcriptional regulator [Arcticibacter eurypsychrophilus]|uniref:Crp/Fnr family transcriptional regulator n=1 Tax=Arcticibacter eurypsychrophilus TaxID=1434752 RepID=UPI001FDF9F13|nr:Crp/Fnr family transcriptional regulator [Arcticibacter eurypsychrophilus]
MEQLQAAINAISAVPKADFDLLQSITKDFSVKKGSYLLEQGAVCKYIYFLKSGFFRMFYVDLNVNEVNFRFTAADNFLVDYQSFLTQQPPRYYWQAMQDAEITAFAYADVQRLYREYPAWEHFGRICPSAYTCS